MYIAQDLLPWMKATPQPVALAVGRVVRAVGSGEKLDACIKAAEVVARFVALASLASSAATRPADVAPPELANFVGNLSFGMFENATHASAAVAWNHPLKAQLRRCFKKRRAVSGQRLAEFVKLRNELGHAITPADEDRARALLERDDPIGHLLELLGDLEDILTYPLLALLTQEHRHGRFLGRFIFFSGEGEPIPQEIELKDPVYEWRTPYLCTEAGLLPLAPGMIYEPRKSDGRYGLYLLDKISDKGLSYKSIQDSREINPPVRADSIGAWMQLPFGPLGARSPHPLLEPIICLDGRSLYAYLSGEAAEPNNSQIPNATGSGDQPDPGGFDRIAADSLQGFERDVNRLALGGTYRDILYCFSEYNSQVELTDGAVQVMASSDPAIVIGTIDIISTPKLRLTLFVSALTSDPSQETEIYELAAGESADPVVDRIKSLMNRN